jgi:hypothetical protein
MPKYAKVKVSKRLLASLEKDMDEAVGMARYGRFKSWLHYANLQSWQEQGWHFNYLNYSGEERHCTCGLAVPIDAQPEINAIEGLDLDPVQVAKGHRKLPELAGVCVAFIYDFEWNAEKGVYFYKALCQSCGSHTELVSNSQAREFENEHNAACGAKRVRRKEVK